MRIGKIEKLQIANKTTDSHGILFIKCYIRSRITCCETIDYIAIKEWRGLV